jgi:hypothetical protein
VEAAGVRCQATLHHVVKARHIGIFGVV